MKYLAFAAALLLPAAAQAAPNAYTVQLSCDASALPCYTAIQLALVAPQGRPPALHRRFCSLLRPKTR
jgi:hypothetical protein